MKNHRKCSDFLFNVRLKVMKLINTVAAAALILFSGAALAERGSDEANKISYPDSSAQHQAGENTFSAAELPIRNSK
ncbi:hypothetical protein [Vreelandella venusta]|uniref:hypothetical protein n=1 Tax=Vreelandella venusta TaxID=44935 RepID=UPI003F666325